MRAGVICRSFSVLSPVPTARHCEFAVRIETFLVRGGAREDGLLYTMAEQVRPHIDFGRVAKPARAQLEVPESFAVGAEGSVVVHSARQVRPSGGFRFALAVSNFRLRARLGLSIPSPLPGRRGVIPAFGYGTPHSSAGGT
jgi:hypothetical protein